MKTKVIWAFATCAALCAPYAANAQDIVVEEQVTTVTTETVNCKPHYYADKSSNWFIQLGAGINTPFVENQGGGHDITVAYNAAFGKWFSPYFGWRMSFLGGPIHWHNNGMNKAKYVNGNIDIMWDMFNSMGGANPNRVFSVIPFVGIGGTYAWDFRPSGAIIDDNGTIKSNSWTLPVSAGIQLRFRLCKYADFFAEGRAQFYGDNFNNLAYGDPVDVNITAVAGFTFNLGGRDFQTYSPCKDLAYIASLNNEINDLRCALNNTAAALAVAEAQLPCPEVKAAPVQKQEAAYTPMMATVRFTINSAKISNEEKVNVYNTAQWMKNNPKQNVVIMGYADKDTGSSAYNKTLSERRAKAVYDMLVNDYGINPDRLSIQAYGSSKQPYDVNNWNRIVIFNAE